jgi:NADP-dependent 3-hydroxy acid dehydrogenase YdfG
MELKGAVVTVTGASAGIGWATAWAFASKGATVVASARRVDRLETLVGEIERRGGAASAVACDVTDFASVEALRDRAIELHGRCDVLVNNAGIPGGGDFLALPIEKIKEVVRTNFLGVVYGTKAFLPGMVERGSGHVVNVASLAGRFAVPGSAVYSATKHAVVALSEGLAYTTVPQGVFVTAVNPGLVATERFPHTDAIEQGRRVMRPERIAEAIVKVVREGIWPVYSVPRWLAAMQVFRVLTPPLYRFGLSRVARSTLRPTNAS